MIKLIVVSISILGLFSCGAPRLIDLEKTPVVTVYYSPAHIRGARTIMPMTISRIRKKMKKKLVSKPLYQNVNSIILLSCVGGKAEDNMMILAETDQGNLGIHQNRTVTVNGKLCSGRHDKQLNEIINQAGLKVRWIK